MTSPEPLPKEIRYLQSVSLFKNLQPHQLDYVLLAGRRRALSAGLFLFYEGDPADHFFLQVEGRIKLTRLTPDGHQVIMSYVNPGEAFAVIAVLSQIQYPVTAQAVTDSQLIIWDEKSMRMLMRRYPDIALNAIRILAQRIGEFQKRIQELATERVERRIAHTLVRLAHRSGRKTEEGILIDFPLTRQDLSEMTGTTMYTVSRILSQWEQQGLILSSRERIIILSPHKLVRIAEDLP